MASLRTMRVSRCGSGCSTVSGISLTILPSAIHLDDAAVAALGDHRVAVVEPLEGVDLDRPLVPAFGFAAYFQTIFFPGVISMTVARPVGNRKLPLGSSCTSSDFGFVLDGPWHVPVELTSGTCPCRRRARDISARRPQSREPQSA